MATTLLIYDDATTELTVPPVLAALGLSPVHLHLSDFHSEYLLSEVFDLIVFELFGENGSCMAILQELESWTATSGCEQPPVIVVTADSSARTERAVRAAKVNFFFIKPLADADLTSAIEQALQLR